MTPDAILDQFATAERIPEDALRAAVGQAAALLPRLAPMIERAAANVTLLPAHEDIVLYGLLALAAARETALCQPFLRLLRLPEDRLAPYFDADPVAAQAAILISVFDGDATALHAAIEDRTIAGDAKWALLAAAARLVWEGRLPRQPFLDLLDRFDRDEMALPDDLAWGGWQDAIRYLGLTGMAARVAAGWAAGRPGAPEDEGDDAWVEGLAWSVAHPEEPRAFDDDGIAAIDDPVAFLGVDDDADDIFADEPVDDAGPRDPDVLDPEALDGRALDWLGRFLLAPETGLSTMSIEMLDGFLTALALGPVRVPREQWLPAVWGEKGPPHFADEEQRRHVATLLDRHAAAIARRAEAGLPPDLLVLPEDRAERPLEWAIGFLEGIDLRAADWQPLFDEVDVEDLLGPIEALADESSDLEDDSFDALPDVLLAIQSYWRRPARVPARSTKVGRNDPCPCGSGKKYKKCHGASTA